MYPQIDKPLRCINIYSCKAFVALWVHPFSHQNVICFDDIGLDIDSRTIRLKHCIDEKMAKMLSNCTGSFFAFHLK